MNPRFAELACIAVLSVGTGLAEGISIHTHIGGGSAINVARPARDPRIPPRRRNRLLAWLRAGDYKDSYAAEPAVHGSLGPHGANVRTYCNPILVDDIRAGRFVWSKGAAMVKELYLGGAENVIGYSVMIKAAAASGSQGEAGSSSRPLTRRATADSTGGGCDCAPTAIRLEPTTCCRVFDQSEVATCRAHT